MEAAFGENRLLGEANWDGNSDCPPPAARNPIRIGEPVTEAL
jgi:hypothetical protein